MEPGTCSACGMPAERAPSGRWWHLGDACMNVSMIVFQPIRWSGDGSVGPMPDRELPAKFVEAK